MSWLSRWRLGRYVSGTVTSGANDCPLAHGTIATLSDRLSPWETSPASCLCVGSSALLIELQMMSSNMEWRWMSWGVFSAWKTAKTSGVDKLTRDQYSGMNWLWSKVSVQQKFWFRVPRKQLEVCKANHQSKGRSCLESAVVDIGYSWSDECDEDWFHDRNIPSTLNVLHDSLWNGWRRSCPSFMLLPLGFWNHRQQSLAQR